MRNSIKNEALGSIGYCGKHLSFYWSAQMSDKSFSKREYNGFTKDSTFEEIRLKLRHFAEGKECVVNLNKQRIERDWDQYHTPRNLALALVGEVGELCEIFQWRGEVKEGLPDFSDKDFEHVGEEVADVLLYLIRLCDKCNIDLPKVALEKIEKNAKKYPKEKCKSSSKKYTEYKKE